MSSSLFGFNFWKKKSGVSRKKKLESMVVSDFRRLNSTAFYDVTNDVKENNDHRQVTLLVIGAGRRGNVYSQYSKDFPERLKIVGVAEPKRTRRSMFQIRYEIEAGHTFVDWKEAASKERFADAVLIATLDDMHYAPCIAFADLGYHILCEKPMAPTEKECEEMVEACKRNNVMLSVGHVLRYNNAYMAVKKIINDGTIGDVVGIQYLQPVGWWHFADSFVRGNFNKSTKNLGSLMTKCCHDLDLIIHFLGDLKCKKIQSFGSLTHFSESIGGNDPYVNCKIERSSVQHYLEPIKRGFLNCTFCMDTDIIETIMSGLNPIYPDKSVLYYSDTDNDFCDYQTINMEFENGKYVTFTMSACTKDTCCRKVDIFGTKGQVECSDSGVKLCDYETGKNSLMQTSLPMEFTSMSGHGFSDYYLMKDFVKAVAENDNDFIQFGPEDNLRGYRLVFAAAKSWKVRGVMLDVNI